MAPEKCKAVLAGMMVPERLVLFKRSEIVEAVELLQ